MKQTESISAPHGAIPGAKKKLSHRERRVLLRLFRKGNVPEEYLYQSGFKSTDYGLVYASSRKNGLSRFESFYNALFIHALYRFDKSKKDVPEELKNTFSHPKGWYSDSFYTWKNNFWSRFVGMLQRFPQLLRRFGEFFRHLPANIVRRYHAGVERIDSSFGIFSGFLRLLGDAVPLLIAAAIALPLGFYASGLMRRELVLEVSLEGTPIGTVSSDKVIADAKALIEKNLSAAIGDSFRFDSSITYRFVDARGASCLSENDLYSEFYKKAKEYIRPGYGLYIDDTLIAVCENRAVLERTVDDMARRYEENIGSAFSAEANVHVSYANDVSIVPTDAHVDAMLSENEIRRRVGLDPIAEDNFSPSLVLYNLRYQTIGQNVKKSQVEPSELTGIAVPAFTDGTTGVSVTNFLDGSGNASETPSQVTLEYVVTVTEVVEEEVPYETEYIESESYLVGSEKTEDFGSNGYRTATYAVSYQNGVEIGRELIKEDVIVPVHNRIVYVGTRIPSLDELNTTATGTFIMPYQNYLSSSYGIRTISATGTRDFHPAWDIPGKYGSDIAASDAGVVSSISYTSGYGLHVIIDHENGYETVYAHLSEALVDEGQRVAQGEIIAKMGASGNVTGVHVHFEIRKDGVSVDPEEFLGYVEERY